MKYIQMLIPNYSYEVFFGSQTVIGLSEVNKRVDCSAASEVAVNKSRQ